MALALDPTSGHDRATNTAADDPKEMQRLSGDVEAISVTADLSRPEALSG
jgi:hypothetical protein